MDLLQGMLISDFLKISRCYYTIRKRNLRNKELNDMLYHAVDNILE